ncbi:MAG: hypothetical protein WC052_06015 [Patescibacteria group bacterium]
MIDFEKLHSFLPVYAYEYETIGATVGEITYWYPHQHPVGTKPPEGWTRIDRADEFTPAQYAALKAFEASQWFPATVEPEEEATYIVELNGVATSAYFRKHILFDSWDQGWIKLGKSVAPTRWRHFPKL